MTFRKKLIEVALPLEAINVASAREKSIRHGHPSTLHLWWARRPLAACRAVIFASLVDDPDDPTAPPDFIAACRKLPKGKNAIANDTPRQRLFDFIERLVQWENTTDEKVLNTARELIRLATGGNPPPLLDPFAGGGSIPLEAQRLGLEAHASDLNPVAVMINKALIEIPPKFANRPPVNPRDRAGTGGTGGWKGAAGLAADVRYYGEWMREQAWERIGQLYPPVKLSDNYGGGRATVIAWLWARTVPSPNPAAKNVPVPLVRSFWLSKRKGKEVWIEPIIDNKNGQYHFEIRRGTGSPSEGTVSRNGGVCLLTSSPMPLDYIRSQGKMGQMGARLMAIVAQVGSERIYLPPTSEHEAIAEQPVPSWTPDAELADNPRYMAPPLYGMKKHSDLFTPRQLVTLTTFSDLVSECRLRIKEDAEIAGLADNEVRLSDGGTGTAAYADAVAIYLAFCVDKMTTTNSSICTWQTDPTRLVAAFSRQAIGMVWDYAEANPFSGAAGDYQLALESLSKVLENLSPTSEGDVKQQDISTSISNTGAVISTDPPYFDNIGYSDLSDYFYVWLRRSLFEIYPKLFSTLLVPKAEEIVAIPYRFGGNKDKAENFYRNRMNQAFSLICNYTHQDYPVTIFYAFKQAESDQESEASEISIVSTGWETMLDSLIQAGFSVTGTWPMRTELTVALKARMSYLASSIVLVCRPRADNAPVTSRRDFVNTLRRELPVALREMQSGNIAPVDLAQASIGPGMAVYSRYSKVLEPDGQRLSVRTALQLINYELDNYLAEQEGEMDQDSRFAVAWFEQFGFKAGGFGQADVLARAKNTSVDGLANAGLLESGAGKVRLYHWSELEPDWDPAADRRLTTWEAAHHLIERLNTYGEEGAARLLAKLSPDMAAEARQLAYRLYSICERKGWADHARDYNALVISWGASQEQAAGFREQYQQGRLFG